MGQAIARTAALATAMLSPWLIASAAAAATFDETVPFKVARWIDLELTEGPITIHRLRFAELRPGDTHYLQSFEIEIEYSNSGKKDWEMDVELEWLDRAGSPIDGYSTDEGLDDGSDRKLIEIRTSTLAYGLRKAEQLRITLSLVPD